VPDKGPGGILRPKSKVQAVAWRERSLDQEIYI
jgi:hypothetical protein